MKLSYAVCGVMTTASFDDGFDAIATSSEITSHTILDARQCQERRNADGLFLQELYRSSRSERRPEGPKCLGKNDCSFRSNGPARPAAAGPQRPPVTSRPLFDDQTQSRHKFKSCTIIVQLYLLYTHSASKACTFLCPAPFRSGPVLCSYHEQDLCSRHTSRKARYLTSLISFHRSSFPNG